MRKLSLGVTAGLMALLGFWLAKPTPTARAAEQPGGWGTIKGQVIFDGKDIPKQTQPKLNQDQQVCEAAAKKEGKEILTQNWVVNGKNKGVRWVVVWLVNADDPTKPLPIHPALAKPRHAMVDMDQPCCFFEPHILCLREGQSVEAKNSAPVPHNYKIDSTGGNPNLNQLIPPGKSITIEGWKATTPPGAPSQVSCTIHSWMKGYVFVFATPYFAVTDEDGNFEIKNAPAGKCGIVMWQEETGRFLAGGEKKGQPIEVKAGQTTDLGQFKLKP